MSLRVIETFSGIGAQAKALKKIADTNPSFNYEILATVEWEIGAMFAYDIIHNGKQDLNKYATLSKQDLIAILSKYNLSSDGKQPLSKDGLKKMPLEQLKAVYHSIEANNNYVDISSVHAWDLPEADLLTYSFPCQDLSISSYWHKNFTGINRDANNRSSLLWEIERILKEYDVTKLKKPRFLLMENVTAIKSPRNIDNFEIWKKELKQMGYRSYTDMDLNAKNFGIPQNRVRTYMLSILVDDDEQWNDICNMLDNSALHQVLDDPDIAPYLRLDYNAREEYYLEALESTPNWTTSRKSIFKDSSTLAEGTITTGKIAKTITTKQDRNPNAGLIVHQLSLEGDKAPYRNLTPRETFLLMGFEEKDFDRLSENNFSISKNRKFLSHSKLLKLSGNSIVVDVLQQIFIEVNKINNRFFSNIVKIKKKIS